jgi:hypothetical protein
LLRAGAFVRCSVADNGSTPAQVQPGRGLRIVEELSRSLDGRVERRFGPRGSISTVIFPYGHQKTEALREPPRALIRESQSSAEDRAEMPDPDRASEQRWRLPSKTMP